MKSKKKRLRDSRLYVIVDKKASGTRSILDIVNKIRKCNIDIVQLRDKDSSKDYILKDALLMHKLLSATRKIFIVNDYLDIAKIIDTDGLHLGQDDTSIEVARRVLGQEKIIGVSCHNLKQALSAQRSGADYISFGPIHSTPTKSEYAAIGLNSLKKLKEKIKIPFFVIGGINQDNLSEIISSGVKRVAVCRAVLKAENIHNSVKNLQNKLRKL